MFAPNRSIRHLQRYSEIVAIFARHGFGFLFHRPETKSRRWLRASWRGPQKIEPPSEDTLAVHFRTVMMSDNEHLVRFSHCEPGRFLTKTVKALNWRDRSFQ